MESQGLLYNENYTRTFRRGPKPTQGDNQKRKIFFALDGLVGAVGLILFGFAVLLSIKGGWSESGIHDINSETKTAIYMLAVFTMFTSVIGGFGAYTRWKTLIVTYSILSLMCLTFHGYIVYSVKDVSSNAFRDMSRAWWDVINDDTKELIQDTHNCCGFKDIRDFAVTSNVCQKQVIETYTTVPAEIKEPADVKKKDSYFKANQNKINVKTSAGTVTAVGNAGAAAGAAKSTAAGAGTGAGGVGTTGAAAGGVGTTGAAAGGVGATKSVGAGAGAGANAGGVGAAGAATAGGVADDGVGDAEGELRKRQLAGEVGAEDAGADAGVEDAGADAGVDAGADVDADAGVGAAGAGAGAGGVGGVGAGAGADGGVAGAGVGAGAGGAAGANAGANTAGKTTSSTTSNTTGPIDPSVPGGCSEYLSGIVANKLKTVYMGLAGLCVAYLIGSLYGWIYWKALRGFKEFDEFA